MPQYSEAKEICICFIKTRMGQIFSISIIQEISGAFRKQRHDEKRRNVVYT